MGKNIHIVPHFHWDREWYFTSEESRIYLVNDMEEILDMLEKHPDHPCFVLDGQTSILEDYLDSIVLKPQGSYTDESYQAYKDAYDALMNADPADLSVREFLELQNAFEKAELGLTIKDSEIADEDKDDAGDTPTGVAAAPISAAAGMLALSAAALFVLQRKKKEQ